MSGPTIGRIVHFVLPYGHVGAVRPAVVIEATGLRVDLHVFTKPGDHCAPYAAQAEFSPIAKPGTWHWPDRPTSPA